MKFLNPVTLIALAVAAGATTPVPSGGIGSAIWSTTTNGPLYWSGSAWVVTADFIGPASSTDNAIVRFNGTGGKTGQNSAATVSDDGVIRSATNSGANAVSVPLVNFITLGSNYTLTSTTSKQKLFNTTTNGRLTLPTGLYRFDSHLLITTMSANSGNAAFSVDGAGSTAGITVVAQDSYGAEGTAAGILTPLTLSGSGSNTADTAASAITAATSVAMRVRWSGLFKVTSAGTIVPNIALVTAAAAVVLAASWFTVEKIGENGDSYLGAWT